MAVICTESLISGERKNELDSRANRIRLALVLAESKSSVMDCTFSEMSILSFPLPMRIIVFG